MPSASSHPPKIFDPLLIGSAVRFRRHAPDFYTRTLERYGDAARFRLGRRKVYLMFHPDHADHVLRGDPANYPRAGYDKLEPLLGDGLLSSEGQNWRFQRRAAQPAFAAMHLRQMMDAVSGAVDESCERLAAAARGGGPIDVEHEMNRLALAMLGRALFGRDLATVAHGVNEALRYVLWYGTRRIGQILPLPAWAPTPRNRRYRRALADLDRVVGALIEERRHDPGSGDLLSLLADYHEPHTGRPMTGDLLRDNVMTFLTAGHETTAKALTWIFYLMDVFPDHARPVRQESRAVLSSAPLEYASLKHLSYTTLFIKESLRLFPPVPGLARKVLRDDVVGGYKVPAGSRLILSPYATHRHPGFWPDPARFDPDRFTGTSSAGRPPFAYFPFGGGPRQCIGTNFAMMELRVAFAKIASRFSFTRLSGRPVETESLFTLRPAGGMPMRVELYE